MTTPTISTRPSSTTHEWYDGEEKTIHHTRTVVTDCTPVPPPSTAGWSEIQTRRVKHRITYQNPPSWDQQEREQRVAVQFQGYKVLVRWQSKIEETRGDSSNSDTPAQSRTLLREEWEDEMVLDFGAYVLGTGVPNATFAPPQASPTPATAPAASSVHLPGAHHMQSHFPPPSAYPRGPPPPPPPTPPLPPGPPPTNFYTHHPPPPRPAPPHHPHHNRNLSTLATVPAPFFTSPSPTPAAHRHSYGHINNPLEIDSDPEDSLFVGSAATPRSHHAQYGPATSLGARAGLSASRKKGKRKAT